jgi:hypothetical protein
MASGRCSRCLACESEIHSIWTRKQVADLSDQYVALTLRLPLSEIPNELLKEKREQLRLRRLVNEFKQAIENRSES